MDEVVVILRNRHNIDMIIQSHETYRLSVVVFCVHFDKKVIKKSKMALLCWLFGYFGISRSASDTKQARLAKT